MERMLLGATIILTPLEAWSLSTTRLDLKDTLRPGMSRRELFKLKPEIFLVPGLDLLLVWMMWGPLLLLFLPRTQTVVCPSQT